MRPLRRARPLLILIALTVAVAFGLRADGAASTSVIQGDADCSQGVGTSDVAAVLDYAGSLTDGLPCQAAANVNCDGKIDARDALGILRFAAGLDDDTAECGAEELRSRFGPRIQPGPPTLELDI
ncbi:MAG: hypothetical protein WD904_07930 [Dehalococcoidia bacterium]